MFRDQPFGRNILNSVVVAASVVAVSLALAASAAFALGRVAFRGRGVMLAAILAVSMFPQVAVLSGLFELIRWLGLYNNLLSLVFSYLIFTLPFTVWVLTTFMRGDAARVGGSRDDRRRHALRGADAGLPAIDGPAHWRPPGCSPSSPRGTSSCSPSPSRSDG